MPFSHYLMNVILVSITLAALYLDQVFVFFELFKVTFRGGIKLLGKFCTKSVCSIRCKNSEKYFEAKM